MVKEKFSPFFQFFVLKESVKFLNTDPWRFDKVIFYHGSFPLRSFPLIMCILSLQQYHKLLKGWKCWSTDSTVLPIRGQKSDKVEKGPGASDF